MNTQFFLIIGLLVLTPVSMCFAQTEQESNKSIAPSLNVSKGEGNERKWRIAYFEGQSVKTHHQALLAIINGLMEIQWLERQEIPEQYQSFTPNLTKELWDWLHANIKSQYIEFVPDGFWSLEVSDEGQNESRSLRLRLKQEILNRINAQQDIDLILAMGEAAGQDLANDEHSVPTVIAAVRDPVAAGIMEDYKYSGYSHVMARTNPQRYRQQIGLFHDIVGFQKLGFAYEKSQADRRQGAIRNIELMSQERGFELVPCHYRDISTEQTALQSGQDCYDFLAKNADAVYITYHPKVITLKNLPKLLKILEKFKIKTFSQMGSEQVEHGILLSIAQAKFVYMGHFYAEAIAKILNGAQPGSLLQIFSDPPKLAINLQTAKRIGYDPPITILGIADEIYQETKVAK